MIRINQLKIKPNHTEAMLEESIRKALHINNKYTFTYNIVKQSIDARKKPDIVYIYSVDVSICGYDINSELKLIKKVNSKDVMHTKEIKYEFPANPIKNNVVIVGSGPAGLISGLMLARNNINVTIIERGHDVERRSIKVSDFWDNNLLDTECNVQFGEGGAGTFSDGKLNTQIKDASGKIKKVLEIFVEFGAPKSILYVSKPHIGTDILINVVKNIRNEIIRLGGKVIFDAKLTDILLKDGVLSAIQYNNHEIIQCNRLILAIGHSARDTFEMLYNKGINMQSKAFAVGVRIEHPQSMINYYAYGDTIYDLPTASYKVTYNTNGRGVYSFCMCPGGYVVNASSEKDRLCVNGMSYSDRGSYNANSAIIVTVSPEDYGNEHPLSGMYFQRRLEEAAYNIGKGYIPSQTYKSFKDNVKDISLGSLRPCTKGNYTLCNLRDILPDYICETIIEGIEGFSKQISDFNMDDAILHAVESRTSSPVRINRDERLMSNIYGIIPCGEGAGYAGGITSAAVDGIRAAEAACDCYKGVNNG